MIGQFLRFVFQRLLSLAQQWRDITPPLAPCINEMPAQASADTSASASADTSASESADTNTNTDAHALVEADAEPATPVNSDASADATPIAVRNMQVRDPYETSYATAGGDCHHCDRGCYQLT